VDQASATVVVFFPVVVVAIDDFSPKVIRSSKRTALDEKDLN
jgi:hypothetical protein